MKKSIFGQRSRVLFSGRSTVLDAGTASGPAPVARRWKKSLVALGTLAASGVSMAQSSVTLYGWVDANVASVTTNTLNGAVITSLKQQKVDGGSINGNRWGLKGSEDLGGGTSAVFDLLGGFSIDTGAQTLGSLFGRRAAFGLSSRTWGTVLLGRNSSSYDDIIPDGTLHGAATLDPGSNVSPILAADSAGGNSAFTAVRAASAISTIAGSLAFLNRTNSWVGYNVRFNNSVKYSTPVFSGFSASVMWAPGEDKTPTTSASASYAAHLKYANGPLVLSGGFQSEAGTVTATTKPALENTLLNVSYDFGVAKVTGQFNRAKFRDVTVGGVAFAPQKEFAFGVAVPVGPAVLSAVYGQSRGDTLGTSKGLGLRAKYALSKRTFLYAGAISTQNFDKVAAAARASFPGSKIGRTSNYQLGINHNF
ncbi:MAG: porin [Pseudomonadota bacterium]